MTQTELTEFATRYAAAWSSQTPDELASFYAVDGSLTVNDGDPSVGRAAIAAKAGAFMDAFPDMVVQLDSVSQEGDHATFHWVWTGTNSGPGGTGRSVHIRGYEEWTFDADGLIAKSKGHYDEAEYERQMSVVCSESFYRMIEEKLSTGDGAGHGPDLGSDEWKSVVEFKLGIRGEPGVPDRDSDDWCGYIEQILR